MHTTTAGALAAHQIMQGLVYAHRGVQGGNALQGTMDFRADLPAISDDTGTANDAELVDEQWFALHQALTRETKRKFQPS
jgi:hypothetical protein